MQHRILTVELIDSFAESLKKEYSESTQERYRRDVINFFHHVRNREITQEVCTEYEEALKSRYSAGSIITILNGLNTFFGFAGWNECKIQVPKLQPVEGLCKSRLTVAEYMRLLTEAERMGDQRLSLLMQTLCTLQLRVSEHPLITREAVEQGYIVLPRKGSRRVLYIPSDLKLKLLEYCQWKQIARGPVFRTSHGGTYHRSNIHKAMKQLCRGAGVDADKVNPQQLLNLAVTELVVQIIPEDKNAI